MQCVIIAAGKGTRMMPLTADTPKPLVRVCGKPLIEHVVAALPEEVTELIFVVGYKADQIKAYCGEEYFGRKVSYCKQENFSGGTGDALMCASEMIKGKFLFMYADDIHGKEALKAATLEEHAMLAATSDTPEIYGVLKVNDQNELIEIIEKPKQPPSNLVNIGGFVLQPDIFSYATDISSDHGEILATDMVTAYAVDHPVKVVIQDTWISVGSPKDIGKAEAVLCP